MARTRLVTALLALWSATLAVCLFLAVNFSALSWWPLAVAGVWVTAIAVSFTVAILADRAQRRVLSALGEAVGSGPIGKSREIEHMRAITANLCVRLERAMTYCAAFEAWLGHWSAEGFAPVRAAWLARAAGLGGPVMATGRSGVFEGLDEAGGLILRDAAGVARVITAGEAFFGEPACC